MFFKKKEKPQAPNVGMSNFKEIVQKRDVGILLDFWGTGCNPCNVMSPIIDELAHEYKDKAIIAKVSVNQNPQLAQQFGIKSVPTLCFIKNGRLIERISGLIPKPNLQEMVEDLIAYDFFEEEE